MSAKPHVVIVGGGFAGLETTFYLRHVLGDRVALTLISDRDHFVYKPNTIYIPFGEDPEKFKIALAKPAKKKNINLQIDKVNGFDFDRKKVLTDTAEIDYDFVVIATGAAMRPEEVPGLAEYALTPWTLEDMMDLRNGLQKLIENAKHGQSQKLLFLIPPNNKCSGPLYELVMMIDTHLRRKNIRDRVEITWTTFEEGFIQAFGPRLNTVVEDEFEQRGIHGHRGLVVSEVQPGKVLYRSGDLLPYDLLLSFPPYVAKEQFSGLQLDNRGFIKVEADSRRVKGVDSTFAVGDAANFPIKQAFLALLQADAAAEHIAAEIKGQEVKPEGKFEPISMCVMEELNKATFAQVPLKYTEDPEKPVAVDTEATDEYKVGISPIWRVGKETLAIYLPWRFGSGEPFHAGFAWDAMDFGLKVMSRVLAK